MSATYTAANIAAALGRSPRSVRKGLAAIPGTGVRVVSAAEGRPSDEDDSCRPVQADCARQAEALVQPNRNNRQPGDKK